MMNKLFIYDAPLDEENLKVVYEDQPHIVVYETKKGDIKITIGETTYNKLRLVVDHFAIRLGYLDLEQRFFNQYLPDFGFTTADRLGALSEAPCLLYDNKIWWYSNYQIRSPLNDLLDNRYTIFNSQ